MALTDWRDYIAERGHPIFAVLWYWIVRIGIWSVFARGWIAITTDLLAGS